jgi:hypothetical protein
MPKDDMAPVVGFTWQISQKLECTEYVMTGAEGVGEVTRAGSDGSVGLVTIAVLVGFHSRVWANPTEKPYTCRNLKVLS